MINKKKIVERKCVGCGLIKDKKELIRVVKSPEGGIVSVDKTGKKQGRGAYICNDIDCFKKAKKTKKLERNLSTSISDEVFLLLENSILAVEL